MSTTPDFQLAPQTTSAIARVDSSPISILEKAINGGVTAGNLAVVKDLIAMCREQRAEDAKAAFNRAFFNMKKNMPEIYADKERKDLGGYRYCSEEEISKQVEPHLTNYGFSMLPGQTQSEGRITVAITLMHEAGHSETREYTVRTGRSNAAKDDSQADAGASTTAWRHLMIKIFGLKSRISENGDARNEGETISPDKAIHLREQVAEVGFKEDVFFRLAGAPTYETIKSGNYDMVCRVIEEKRQANKAKGRA